MQSLLVIEPEVFFDPGPCFRHRLVAPEFRQVHAAAASLVRVALRNDVRQRRAWVDADVASVVGESLLKGLNADEKRAINFAAEYGAVSVGDVQRLTQRSWRSAKRLLANLVVKRILEHRIGKDLDRDPQGRFVIGAISPELRIKRLRRALDERPKEAKTGSSAVS